MITNGGKGVNMENLQKCSECGDSVATLWNRGRCWDCHDASCAYSLNGDSAPDAFDPAYAGERWDDDY
jgi:hypothetical protein